MNSALFPSEGKDGLGAKTSSLDRHRLVSGDYDRKRGPPTFREKKEKRV